MSETLVMSKKERTKAHDIRLLAQGSMSITEVSEALRLYERQCYRLKADYLDCGDAAVVHTLRGRCSNNHYPAETRDLVLGLVRRVYTDFGPTLLSEMLESTSSDLIGQMILVVSRILCKREFFTKGRKFRPALRGVGNRTVWGQTEPRTVRRPGTALVTSHLVRLSCTFR